MPTKQTEEEIREEWRKDVKEMSNNFYNYGSIEKIADWWLSKLHSTLRSQLEEVRDLVKSQPLTASKSYNHALRDISSLLQSKIDNLNK